MRRTTFIITLFIITLSFNVKSQTIGEFPSDSTIKNQIDWVFKKSYSYQDNKVITTTKFTQLTKNINDSLNLLKKVLAEEKSVVSNQKITINNIEKTISTLDDEIVLLNNEKNGIYFLGKLVTKKVYNTYLWSIIGVLTITLLFFIFKFKNSNHTTTKTKKELNDVQNRFETFRKKALEKEQILMRKLQDELNKKN